METSLNQLLRSFGLTDITCLVPERIHRDSAIDFVVVQGTRITGSGIKPRYIAVKTSDVLPTLLNPKIIKLVKEVQQYFCPNCPVTYHQLYKADIQLEYTLIPLYNVVYSYHHIAEFINSSEINYTYALPFRTNAFEEANHVLVCEPDKPITYQLLRNHNTELNRMQAQHTTIPFEELQKYVYITEIKQSYDLAETLWKSIRVQLYSRLIDRGLNEKETDKVMKNINTLIIMNYFSDKYTSVFYDYILNYPSGYLCASLTLDT